MGACASTGLARNAQIVRIVAGVVGFFGGEGQGKDLHFAQRKSLGSRSRDLKCKGVRPPGICADALHAGHLCRHTRWLNITRASVAIDVNAEAAETIAATVGAVGDLHVTELHSL